MSYFEQLRSIANTYFNEHDGSATARDIAEWAIKTKLWAPQPESITTADWASVTLQVTVTSEVCQPFEPTVPETTLVITGGVESVGAGGATVSVIDTSPEDEELRSLSLPVHRARYA